MPEGVVIRKLQPQLRLALPTKHFVPPKNPKPQRWLKDYPPPTPQPTPCRLWQGATDKYGYGKKKVMYSRVSGWESEKIHRWVVNMTREVRLRPDQVILHLCDQPLCYRLSHLRVGTIQENNADMLAKGRASKPPVNILLGEKHGMSKLTKAAVKLMKEMDEAGASQVEIARAFDISRTTVRRVLRGLSWRDDADPDDDVPGPGTRGGSDPRQDAEGEADQA